MPTTPITYVGRYDSVYVPVLGLDIAKDETVDVDSEIAKSLLEQPDNWKPGKKSTTKSEEN